MKAKKTSATQSSETEERQDRRRKLTQGDMERIQVPKLYWKAQFEKISEGDHKDVVERYLRRIVQAKKNGYGMVLWGQNSRGKSGISVVILKAARRLKYTCLFITAAQYRERAMGGEMFDDGVSIKSWCRFVDFLVIDDLHKEPGNNHGSGGSERMMESLIRDRVSNMKATIITMNADPKEMKERYGWSMQSLMSERFGFVKVVGPSLRTDGVREVQQFLTE